MTPLPQFRYRTFYYHYCHRTETDKVCTKCDTIVVGDICLTCTRDQRRTAARLQELKARKERERTERRTA